MLLPAFLYFTLNRFDILPVYLCLLSFFFLKQNRFVLSAILLAIGTFTKWYPILLFPIYLAYYWSLYKRIGWKMIIAFGLTSILIILPTLVFGGWNAFLVPYKFHLERGLEKISLPALIGNLMRSRGITTPPLINFIFIGLQFVLPALSIFFRPDNLKKVLNWSILVVTFFILFSNIWSPQWILWVLPMLILACETRWDILWVVIGGCVTYLAFPVFYDIVGYKNEVMVLMGIANILFFSRSALRSYFSLWKRAQPLPVDL